MAHLRHIRNLASDADVAGLAGHVAKQRVQQCRLTSADAADNRNDLARRHMEVRYIQAEGVVVVAGELEPGGPLRSSTMCFAPNNELNTPHRLQHAIYLHYQ